MLQRGRGLGFLKALADPVAARPLLVRCVIEDPRTDRQVEDRENYYGELAVALDLDITPLTGHLFSGDATEDPWRTGLTLAVLANMARRGRSDTIPVLRDYVLRGSNWSWAVLDLESIGSVATDGLAEAVAGRFDDEAIVDATGYEGGEVWDRWRAESARLADAHRRAKAQRPPRQPDERPTTALLESRNGWGVLRHRRSDAETFRRVARDDHASVTARRNALIVLGDLRDSSLIDVADEALASGSKDLEFGAWRYLVQLLKDGPVAQILTWADRGGGHGRIAAHMLGDWGEQSDAPLMRRMLANLPDDDEYFYARCDVIEGLARAGDQSDLPILRRTFEEADYSWLRIRAGRGLARLLPSFPTTVAVECLWDCEDGLRELGCASVSLDANGVRERLSALAGAAVEEKGVREAALARIA